MAVPVNTLQTFAMIGIREDLSDYISNISPTDTPAYSMARKGKASSRTPEFMTDVLEKPNPDNKTIEGDDATNDTLGEPTRHRNAVQLMDKVIQVSSTADAVNAAGRSSESSYQKMKKMKELKRDIEMRITGNFPTVIGNAGAPGELAGMEAFIATNVDRAGGATAGGWNNGTQLYEAETDGATRAITEDMLKNVHRQVWENGGDGSMVLANGTNKQAISGFTGIATQYRENRGTRQGTILGAADVYVGDFGTMNIYANRFMSAGVGRTAIATSQEGLYPGRTVLVLSPRTWEVKFLQPFKTEPLAKTGHSKRAMISTEFTLCCRNERANGKIADIA